MFSLNKATQNESRATPPTIQHAMTETHQRTDFKSITFLWYLVLTAPDFMPIIPLL